MQIHQLTVKKRQKSKTIGRGGKRGTYSGRGNKGQKARSGASVDPLFEGGRSSLVERLKKVRGFKSMHPKKNVVTLAQLDSKFKDSDVVSIQALVAAKLVDKKDAHKGVKILTGGTLNKKLTLEKEILFSKSAEDAIVKAGGTINK